MTAQNLPQDLVQPSSGYKNWLRRWRGRTCAFTFDRH